MIEKAIAFATKAHQGQYRKGTKIPYILHPLEAGIIVSQMRYDEELICAAILHDVIEDGGILKETLRNEFGSRVAELVALESEDKSKTWKERKTATLNHLREEKNEDVGILVFADKLSNMRAIKTDYEGLGDKLWEKFNEKDKAEHYWYYNGILENLSYLSKYHFYSEFKNLINFVWGR